jgi:hypothetical protein
MGYLTLSAGGQFLALEAAAAVDADAAAFLAAAGIADATTAAAVGGLVVALKAAGVWGKMDAAYPFVGGTADAHKWNLKDPRDLDAAFRLTFDRGTHSAALGYRPNPAGDVSGGGAADTHYTPASSGQMTNQSCHLAYYSTADTAAASKCEIGNYNWDGNGYRFHVIARYSGDLFYYGMCAGGAESVANAACLGLLAANRLGTAMSAYRDGVALATTNPAATALPTNTTVVGGINDFIDRTDRPCGFASLGAGLTAGEHAALYAAVQAFQTALGRAV